MFQRMNPHRADERELTYLVASIGLINMWNRFGVTFQLAPPSASGAPAA